MPSPNRDARPAGAQVSLLVLHNISSPSGRFGGPEAAGLFLNRLDYGSHPWLRAAARPARVGALLHPRRRRSDPVRVHRGPRLARGVRYAGRERRNDFSIGIELEGTDTQPYADAQYQAPLRQLAPLRARYPLAAAWGTHRPAARPTPGQLSTGRASGAKTARRGNCRPPDAPSHHQGTDMLKIWGRLTSVNAESHAGRARTGAAARVHPGRRRAWRGRHD